MSQWYLRTQDETFGPEDRSKLIEWARMGRIQPGQEISEDNEIWHRVEEVSFLDMRFSIDLGDGNPRGPFNRAAAEALLASGKLPPTATIVETRAPFPPEPETIEKVVEVPVDRIVEKIVEVPVEKVVEKVVEVPVEKIVEKIVEVPVDRIVEKIVEKEVRVEIPVEKEIIKEVEKIVEVPVEKEIIKEVEKIVVDERRIAELEILLKGANERNDQLSEKIASLEAELKRLPQSASEVADIRAAVYSIITDETNELERIIEAEKREAEEFMRMHRERAEKLLRRRHELLCKSGGSIDEMTRKALVANPEDPRTAQLRQELDELRRVSERNSVEAERTIRELTAQLKLRQTENLRTVAGDKDMAQLRTEIEELRSKLQTREQELLSERQANESLRQMQAVKQQTLMARLASLESPSIGTVASMETNQSREAKQVKLPGWMRLRK